MRQYAFGYGKKSILDKLIQYFRKKKIINYIPQNSVVADLGCGYDAAFLVDISSGIKKGIGLDILFQKKTYPENVRLIKTDLESKITLPNQSVDVVVALAVLEHLYKPDVLIKEAYRILRPGGSIILTTPSDFSKPLLEFMAFKLRIISTEEIRDHKRYYNKNNLKWVLINSGFKNITVNYFELWLNIFAIAQK